MLAGTSLLVWIIFGDGVSLLMFILGLPFPNDGSLLPPRPHTPLYTTKVAAHQPQATTKQHCSMAYHRLPRAPSSDTIKSFGEISGGCVSCLVLGSTLVVLLKEAKLVLYICPL